MLAQAAHVTHILLAADCVDDGARGKEEQCLEEGVGDKMEDGGRVGCSAAGQEHVAKLRDGGVGQDALDVVCRTPTVAAKNAVAAPMMATTGARGRAVEDRVWPDDHVDAGRHHGGSVDERRNRRRTFHGIGQPDVKRNLRRLAGGAEDEQQRDGGEEPACHSRCCAIWLATSLKLSVPKCTMRRNIASRKPKSPMRLTMNAFMPAFAAECFLK